jgi:Na+:H+ antiporter, NhaB family
MTASMTLPQALARNFLGQAPVAYKWAVIGCLLLNPLLLWMFGPVVAGWCVVAEFIFMLAMALKCYPLQPGGLLAIQSVVLGLTSPGTLYQETLTAFPVILLLIFMVAGIYFLKELLLYTFTNILLSVRSQSLLALLFCFTAALLSAFLDALTVLAVIITVGAGFYEVYHRVASGKGHAKHDESNEHDVSTDSQVEELHRSDLDAFRAFLRGLMMHAAVGTALGGVTTMVGEPQNLLIAQQAEWDFVEFFVHSWRATMPILAVGLLTCFVVDRFRWFGYGTPLPQVVRDILHEHHQAQVAKHSAKDRAVLIVQALAAVALVLGLGFHVAEVGLVGLGVIVISTAFTGVTEEHRLGKAFETALPFTALLVVFFAIVAVIHDQHLFEPVITAVLNLGGDSRVAMMYVANGLLSAISDNVFVATIYIREVKAAYLQGTLSREQFEHLAVAVNVGTNIPSVATPNGQAAFLFLLTSTLAPLIRLSYGRMMWMALPYTIVLSVVGLIAVVWWL